MDYKKSYILFHTGLWGGILIGLLGAAVINSKIIAYIGLTVLGLSYAQVFIYYRCPHCKEMLNIRGRMPKFCPECGGNLE